MPALLGLGALVACGDEAVDSRAAPQVDPMVQAALDDQLLVDTDLSGQNEANAALTGGIDHALPLPETGEAARRAALDEARDIIARTGSEAKLPKATDGAALSQAATLSVVAFARETLGDDPCVDAMAQDFGWAGRMPAELPVYPRGAVQQAAGADRGGCAVRAVDFRTAVAPNDLLEFYNATASAAGYRTALTHRGPNAVLEGGKAGARFALRARALDGGLTEVDLATRSD